MSGIDATKLAPTQEEQLFASAVDEHVLAGLMHKETIQALLAAQAPTTGLLAEIATLLRSQATRTQVPWERLLWTADDIAAHLQVSPRTVAEKYAPRPTFPRPVNPGGGHNRWYAHEIIDWVDSTRRPKPRAARAH